MARYKVLDGNTRNGRFIRQNHSDVFVGERRNKHGAMEEKTFRGKAYEANREWRAWQAEIKDETTITVEKKAAPKPQKEGAKQVATTQKAEPKEVYVLAFVDAYEKRTDIGVYFDMGKAADMVDALTVAAKATGQKGEYDVFKLDVRG